MIRVKDIHKSFGSLEVLKGVDLEIKKGEIVSIIGKSGAGKTTLLQIIGTLDKADCGTILFNNGENVCDINSLNDKELAEFRNIRGRNAEDSVPYKHSVTVSYKHPRPAR